MILTAHQPGYWPWLGYFEKIARSDLFVLLDHVQYEPHNFQNRNRIKVNNGSLWLTVPIKRQHAVPICEQRIATEPRSRHHWQERTLRTLFHHYGHAPYFDEYAEEIVDIYRRPWQRLVDLDEELIERMMGWMGIVRPMVRSSSLKLSGQKSSMIVSLCQRLGAKRYLSGSGGSRDYLDVEEFRRSGITVEWQNFIHPTYPQCYPKLGFVPRLAAIDLLFNCGPRSRCYLNGDTARVALASGGQ